MGDFMGIFGKCRDFVGIIEGFYGFFGKCRDFVGNVREI